MEGPCFSHGQLYKLPFQKPVDLLMLCSVQIAKFTSHGKHRYHGATYTSNVVYPKILNWFASYCLFVYNYHEIITDCTLIIRYYMLLNCWYRTCSYVSSLDTTCICVIKWNTESVFIFSSVWYSYTISRITILMSCFIGYWWTATHFERVTVS